MGYLRCALDLLKESRATQTESPARSIENLDSVDDHAIHGTDGKVVP